jgi:hypothetical protein
MIRGLGNSQMDLGGGLGSFRAGRFVLGAAGDERDDGGEKESETIHDWKGKGWEWTTVW